MPTYDYECKKCGKTFEIFLGISELDIVEPKCPTCKSICRRLISGGTGVIFKGSGFYVNDYAKKESKTKEQDKNEEVKAKD